MRLIYDPNLCLNCETFDCFTKCPYLNYDLDRAKAERLKIVRGEYSDALRECMTCYACEEFCPYNNHPFYQIAELQEAYGVRFIDEDRLNELIERYKPIGEFKPKRVGERVIHICLFPEFKELIKGKIFEGIDVVRGRHLFCNLIYLHFGAISVIKERAGKVIDNMSKLRANEIILFHDECYGFYNSFAKAYGFKIPFKPIHLFEFLYRRLKELEDEIKKLNIKAAYQRPCSNRLCPETDKILDNILDLIGVERVEREYDRENAICCGAAFEFAGRKDIAEELQRRNLGDIIESKATHVIFNCPMCYLTLSEKVCGAGIMPVMLSELCRMAIGEIKK